MEILATHIPNTRGPSELQRAELNSLLRPGRVLAGLVTEVTPSEALLRVGQYTLSATVHPNLEAGQHLLLQVTGETTGDGILLKLLGGASGQDSGLLRALRSVVGSDRPLGELLQQLGRKLAAIESSRPGSSGGLLDRLSAHVYRPGDSGAELMKLLARGGLTYESTLLEAAGKSVSTDDVRLLLLDLKSELLLQLTRLSDGPAREAVARALAGLEAEQLLNVARQEAGEPQHWSFPVPDGDAWTTAHLLWTNYSDENGEQEGGESGEEFQRLSLGVNFSNTGPIRVDAWLRSERLNLRILVNRESVARLIRAASETLLGALEKSGRPVHIVVGVAPAEDLEFEANSMDIRYLREHRLMDVSG